MDENPYRSPTERTQPVPRWRKLLRIAGIALSIMVVAAVAIVMLAFLFAPADFFRR